MEQVDFKFDSIVWFFSRSGHRIECNYFRVDQRNDRNDGKK